MATSPALSCDDGGVVVLLMAVPVAVPWCGGAVALVMRSGCVDGGLAVVASGCDCVCGDCGMAVAPIADASNT